MSMLVLVLPKLCQKIFNLYNEVKKLEINDLLKILFTKELAYNEYTIMYARH